MKTVIIINMSGHSEKVFQDYVESNGLRMTDQRKLVLDVFLKREGHFTTEELYELVKKKDSSVGQATVYRNIKLIAEAGLARELDFGDGPVYYEHKHGHDHHDHIICSECGKRTEVFDEKLEKLQSKIAKENGYKLTGHKLYLFGLCSDCV
jgi:Fur family ferric uptake transcriptional regulator